MQNRTVRHSVVRCVVVGLIAVVLADRARVSAAEEPAVVAKPTETIAEPRPLRGLLEVPHEQVELIEGFWGPRLKTSNEVTVPHALNALERDGHVTNFDKAAGVFDGKPSGHAAFDSDLHKALEGAMHALHHTPNQPLLERVDSILDRCLAAQQEDGFLISYFILQEQPWRWQRLRTMHQMYNAGHFIEMAVAHHRLTGDPKVLKAATRFADHIDGLFGPNKRYDVDGHQEVELALIKLYRATGRRRYLELSRFFLDERGYAHGTERKPFDPATPEAVYEYEKDLPERAKRNRAQARVRNGRMQDIKPVVQQMEVIGHCVRAGYMYSAMTDIARFMDAPDYERALDSLWNDVVSRKMYVTGGIGTNQYHDEGFGDPYLLPNGGYCESCAAVAHVLWQHRMNLLKGQAKYADVMELVLYNGMLSGISVSGDRFNYRNPLVNNGGRSAWIGLSCCPTNMTRIIPQVGGLAYALGKQQIFVNLYAAGEAEVKLDDGAPIKLVQQTEYPWQGNIRLIVTPEPSAAAKFDLCLRIPGWTQGRPVPSDLYQFTDTEVSPIGLKVNGKTHDAAPQKDGYVHLDRSWRAGDVVELELPMPIHRVHAHENVKENLGKTTLMRGPVVYCLEAVDHPNQNIDRLALPRETELRATHRADFLGGVTIIEGQALDEANNPVAITAIPSYAWGNRDRAAMSVWITTAPDRQATP